MASSLIFPYACWVGLASGGFEVTGPRYVRLPTVLSLTAEGDGYSNVDALQWQSTVQPWGLIEDAVFFDAPTAGVELGSCAAVPALEIRQYDIPRIPAGGLMVGYLSVPRPFGTGTWGTFPFGVHKVLTGSVILERGFDQQHVCAPGTWAPGPFSRAA